MEHFLIGTIRLQWDSGGLELLPGKYLELFRCEPAGKERVVQFQGRFVHLEPYVGCPIVTENLVYALFNVNGEHLLVYHWGYRRFAFAVWPDRIGAQSINECWFDPDMRSQPKLNADWFLGVSGLHKALLQRGAAVLHASYINWKGRGILFTAPSGTGKSTQAELWSRYARADIINGDRVLIQRRKSDWYAFGYPCCGSSQICRNLTLPLYAVIVLRQGMENRVQQLSVTQKVQSIAAAIEVYPWDVKEMNRAVDFAVSLAGEIPVICLTCRPEEESVRVLEHYLEEGYAAGI